MDIVTYARNNGHYRCRRKYLMWYLLAEDIGMFNLFILTNPTLDKLNQLIKSIPNAHINQHFHYAYDKKSPEPYNITVDMSATLSRRILNDLGYDHEAGEIISGSPYERIIKLFTDKGINPLDDNQMMQLIKSVIRYRFAMHNTSKNP